MKQLNLFSDQELEAISLKNTAVQQSNTGTKPIKAAEEAPAKPITVKKIEETSEQNSMTEQDLPTSPPVIHTEAPKNSAPIATQAFQNGKTVEKMIVFYTDKTFAVYTPE